MTDATLEPRRRWHRSLGGTAARRRNEGAIRAILMAAAIVSILISAGIVLTLIFEAIAFLGADRAPAAVRAGLVPATRHVLASPTVLAGTLIITVVAMVIAAPIGLASAIYLSEYASHRVRGIIKPILEILAGIPSVVLGFFALTWISPNVVQSIFTDAKGFNLLAAGIGVGILTIPLVASISEDAMRAVPVALREASYGLGARRLTTSIRVVVPAAISGIVAALILAVSRAIGETMVVAVAAGRQRRRAVHRGPDRSRPDAHGCDGRARERQRPGHRQHGGVPEPLLPGPAAVPHDPRLEPHRRRQFVRRTRQTY